MPWGLLSRMVNSGVGKRKGEPIWCGQRLLALTLQGSWGVLGILGTGATVIQQFSGLE